MTKPTFESIQLVPDLGEKGEILQAEEKYTLYSTETTLKCLWNELG